MTTQLEPAPVDRRLVQTDAPESLELRLALVCYGGVSLAIYMHGITKELQSLLRASRAFDRALAAAPAGADPVPDDLPAGSTERAYFTQLVELWRAGLPLSVTVDIVAGTSAGGINGICLAKAAMHDSSQDGLTDLWMSKGDIRHLMRFGVLGRHLGGAATALVLPFKLYRAWSPLKGDDMCRWLYDALAGMDARPGAASLLPDGGTLDLYVTTTDLHGTDQIVPLGDGGGLHDRTFARRFAFHSDPAAAAVVSGLPVPAEQAPITLGDDGGCLAFAARATSCFPGAFPPVSLTEYAGALDGEGSGRRSFDLRRAADALFPDYTLLPTIDPTHVHLVDGGVLDNAPFDHVVEAIARRPAGREVARHLVYIEPDPGADSPATTLAELHPDRPGQQPAQEKPPTWATGVWSALSTIPHHQPLIRSAQSLARINEQVATVGRVTTTLQDDVTRFLAARVQLDPTTGATLTSEQVTKEADKIYAEVPTVIGTLNHRTYCRLKMEAIAGRLATDLADHLTYPPGSAQASFLQAAIMAWVHARPEWTGDDESRQTWLGPRDVPYRERRLQFIIAGINKLFDEATGRQVVTGDVAAAASPSRAQLAALKQEAWALLLAERGKPAQAITAVADRAAFATTEKLGETVLTGDPEGWATEHAHDLEHLVDGYTERLSELSKDSAHQLWEAFQVATADWTDGAARTALAGRYIGFPLWDALLFPLQALSALPLTTPIHTSRFSPRDASALTPERGQGKLQGVATHHFGAFFTLARRQNDYLWGRLDAAEMILGLLREQYDNRRTPTTPALPDRAPLLRTALTAVLDQEQGSLDKIRDTTAKLRAQLG
jgi:patatin-related protein